MFRKIFLLLLVAFFYYWMTSSPANTAVVKSLCNGLSKKIQKMEVHLNFPEKQKKRKW